MKIAPPSCYNENDPLPDYPITIATQPSSSAGILPIAPEAIWLLVMEIERAISDTEKLAQAVEPAPSPEKSE